MKLNAIYRSSETEHLQKLSFKKVSFEGEPTISVLSLEDLQQTFLGFGGALTEASCYVLSLMDEKQRNEVLEGYFSKSGLNYALGRLAIGSSDFSLSSYDYLQGRDESLKSFDVSHEKKYLLPVLKKIEAIRGEPLNLLASPWSPCAWMKDNNDLLHGGHLKKEYYSLWAEYEARYLLAMKELGVTIEKISIQNEPAAAQVWESCLYTAKEEAEYALILRKTLDNHGLQNVGIYIWDHNRDLILERANETLQKAEVNAAVEGIAFHWYVAEDFQNVLKTHLAHPDKHLLFSEGCIETVNRPEVAMGAFRNGERYARNIIGDLEAFAEGWIDWNIVLDEEGGPNHVGNFCEAPIQYNRKTHAVYANPSYFCIAQFSHFISPGSRRVNVLNRSGLKVTAFLNLDGTLVMVVLNEGAKVSGKIQVLDESCFLTFNAHSVTTFIFKA